MENSLEHILNKIVGERIRIQRDEEKKLKQADLAKVLDSSTSLISNIEKGIHSIHLFDLYKIAELLEKEVHYFLPSVEELKKAAPSIERDIRNLSPEEATYVDSLRKEIRKEK
jgi:transcriptional regulator with XRE-family HTH domain